MSTLSPALSGATVRISVTPTLSFRVPKPLHDFAVELADKTKVIWFIGIGPEGAVLTNDREDLLSGGYHHAFGRNHHVAWIMPSAANAKHRHDYRDGDMCSICDHLKPL